MPETRRVRFAQPWRNYNAGELAGFDAKTAAMLVEHGTAAYDDEAPAPAKAAAKGKGKGTATPPAVVEEPVGEQTAAPEAPPADKAARPGKRGTRTK